jgi:acyl-homoserine-lactone acylase
MVRLLEFCRGYAGRMLAAAAAATMVAACGEDGPTIIRTEHRIAHIRADNYKDLGFGVAYAHAEDNYCQTLDHLITLRGQRLEYVGSKGGAQLGLNWRKNEILDRFINFAMNDRELEQAARTMSAEAQALIEGYVEGYAKYVDDHHKELAKLCGNLTWLNKLSKKELKMQRADFLRWMEEFATLMSSATLVEEILAARPPSLPPVKWWQFWKDTGCRSSDESSSTGENPADGGRAGEAGSNGWAFGRDVTAGTGADHPGVLVANPHFFWQGPLRFWQLHLTMGDLDVMGAVMGQWPVVQIGFNKDVAWTHTVSTGKRFVLYKLKIQDPADPCTYVVESPDGKRTGTIERKRIKIRRAQGGPLITEVWHAPGYGPVFAHKNLEWTDQHVYVLRDANHLNPRAIDAWLAIARAKDAAGVANAARNLGIQWSNTIAADRKGDVVYADYSVVPRIADVCLLPEVARDDWPVRSLPVVDGTKARCGWAKDGPVDLIQPKDLPLLPRTDYVLNGNDSFWLINPHQPLSGFSRLVGAIDSEQTLRTRAGLRAVRERVDVKKDKVDLDVARELLLSNRNTAAELVLDDLLAVCPAPTAGDILTAACAALSQWKRTSTHDDKGAVLFRLWWIEYSDKKNKIPWATPFAATSPIDTPRGLDLSDPERAKFALATLRRAAERLAAAQLAAHMQTDLAAPLDQRQTKSFVLKDGEVDTTTLLAVSGGHEMEGVLNKLQFKKNEDVIFEPILGTSYVQIVTFDKDGPVADALLLYGQSSNFGDNEQLQRFFDGRFLRLPFTKADVDARGGKPFNPRAAAK